MSARKPLAPSSSSREPTTFIWPLLQVHTGIGIPQYLCLEMHQSRAFTVQSYSRPEPAHSGVHLTREISLSMRSLTSVTRRYHWSVLRNRMPDLHLQQWP